MGARSGNNYLSAIRKLKADCWIDGVRIVDPITHPALVKYARGIASLYDAQIERPAAMTYRLDDGDRIGLSYIRPSDAEEVEKLSAMYRVWAEVRGAALDFSLEALNSVLAAMAAAAGFFAPSDAHFGQNLMDFYRTARHHDWCMTSNWTEFHGGSEPEAAKEASLTIIERSQEGIRVSGRANLTMPGSLAEKLLMLPSLADASGGIVFAVDCNAAGLRFDHRRDQSSGRPGAEKLGCIAIFDRVAIPDERIFLRDDPARYRAMLEETGAADALIHQAAIQSLVKAETMARAADSGSTSSSDADGWREAAAGLRGLIGQALAAAHMNQWGMLVPARAPLEEALSVFRRINRAE